VTLFVAEERRAILRCAKLRPATLSQAPDAAEKDFILPQDTVTIGRSVDRRDAGCRIGPRCIGNVDSNTLVRIPTWLRLANNDLVNLTILAEILRPAKCHQELVFVAYCRVQANHVDQVLLDDPDPSQVFATGRFDFALFGLLLLRGSSLSMLRCEIRFEPNREPWLATIPCKKTGNTHSSASGTLYCMVLSS
jgi:hypothetical protein